MVIKLHKADFDAGSPYSCWLKEEVTGEIGNYMGGMKNRGLVKKYGIPVFEGIEDFIMDKVTVFDDYPDALKAMAIEIIQTELDPSFKG